MQGLLHVEVRGQSARISSLLPSCVPWGLNSGPQVWKQMPLSAGLPHLPSPCAFYLEC